MKKIIVLFTCYFFINLVLKSQPTSLTWAKTFGNSSNNDVGSSLCVDSKKNVFVVGTFKGTVDFDPSSTDTTALTSTGTYSAYIVKFDSLGNFIWAKSFGGAGFANPTTITVDKNGYIYTAGSFFQTVDFDPNAGVYNLASAGTGGGVFPSPAPSLFIQKLDSNGVFVWALRIGANSESNAGSGQANQIISDENNNVYLAGKVNLNGTLDFDPGPAMVNSTNGKAFLAKYDNTGNLGWITTFGNIGGSGASANSVHLSNNYLYVAGSTTSGVGSISSLLVRKIDLFGTGIWEKRISANHSLYGYSISADNDENVITTGYFDDPSVDFAPGADVFTLTDINGHGFVQKLDPLGNFVWAKNFFGNISSLATDTDNNIYTAGSFSGAVDFDPNDPIALLQTSGTAAFVQKLDANGYLLWAGQFGNSGNEIANGLILDDARNIYLTGTYSGMQDFDPDTANLKTSNQTSIAGSTDVFVLRLANSNAYITTANGDWHDGTTWLGGIVPPPNAAVIVKHIVTVTQNETCYSLIVEKPNGSLTINEGYDLKVNH